MAENHNYREAMELIEQANSILLTTHTKPDGDACGSMRAMQDVLTALGKHVQPLVLTHVPDWYAFLFEQKVPILGEDLSVEDLQGGSLGSFDCVLIVDTNSRTQLGKFTPYLEATDIPVLVIDHHATSDNLGTVEIVDSSAAAAGLVAFGLLKYAGWPVTERIAESLFIAIATDTGWFQFSNTDARVYRVCADLIDLGANPTVLYDKLYNTFSGRRFKLMVAMLNSLELHLDGRYASQHITRQDFERIGAQYVDSENLINECHRIESVKASALFIELKDGRIRCSLRSRGMLDVSQIAQQFGGGGHKMAAGTYLPGPLENAKSLIYERMEASQDKLVASAP